MDSPGADGIQKSRGVAVHWDKTIALIARGEVIQQIIQLEFGEDTDQFVIRIDYVKDQVRFFVQLRINDQGSEELPQSRFSVRRLAWYDWDT